MIIKLQLVIEEINYRVQEEGKITNCLNSVFGYNWFQEEWQKKGVDTVW